MILVTKEEFLAWVESQPDDKIFDFTLNTNDNRCGCPMVQYGRDKGFNFVSVGFSSWFGNNASVAQFQDICFGTFNMTQNKQSMFNYGQLKRSLKEKGLYV